MLEMLMFHCSKKQLHSFDDSQSPHLTLNEFKINFLCNQILFRYKSVYLVVPSMLHEHLTTFFQHAHANNLYLSITFVQLQAIHFGFKVPFKNTRVTKITSFSSSFLINLNYSSPMLFCKYYIIPDY